MLTFEIEDMQGKRENGRRRGGERAVKEGKAFSVSDRFLRRIYGESMASTLLLSASMNEAKRQEQSNATDSLFLLPSMKLSVPYSFLFLPFRLFIVSVSVSVSPFV